MSGILYGGDETEPLHADRLVSSGVIRGPWRTPPRRRVTVWIANTLLITGSFVAAIGGGWLIEKGGERLMLWWMGSL